MTFKMTTKQSKKQPGMIRKSLMLDDNDENDSEDAETESDAEPSKRNINYQNVFSEDDDKDADDSSDETWAALQDPSPLKRKRTMSLGDLFEVPDDSDSVQTPASLNEIDIGDLGDSEDDLDIERYEGEAILQEEEDRTLLQNKFHVADEKQPFAYAPDEESDHASNSEDFWIEDFDALVGGSAVFENPTLPKFQLEKEESTEAQLEEEFFLGYISSDDNLDGSESDEDDEESPFGNEDGDDRVGWECFFSAGDSNSELGDEEEDSEGGTTDDETPAVILARQQASKANPVTPAKTPLKSNLTSCLKNTVVFDDETPSKNVASTPVKLNTSHQPPVLGTWARDTRRPTGIIDGMTTHSPAGLPQPTISRHKKKKVDTFDPYGRSEAMNDAMTSLDDIMYTNDFLVPDTKPAPSKFNKPIHVGAFRKGQQRSSMIREDSYKDEWYHMTSRNKEKSGRTNATPILGVASESLSRKEKRRRKKMKAASGMSVGGSTFGGSIDELSDNEYQDGIERAGLGLGPPVESLFLFHANY